MDIIILNSLLQRTQHVLADTGNPSTALMWMKPSGVSMYQRGCRKQSRLKNPESIFHTKWDRRELTDTDWGFFNICFVRSGLRRSPRPHYPPSHPGPMPPSAARVLSSVNQLIHLSLDIHIYRRSARQFKGALLPFFRVKRTAKIIL